MREKLILSALLLAAVSPATAQLVPDVVPTIDGVVGRVGNIAEPVTESVAPVVSRASALARARLDALGRLVSANPDRLETIERGEIAVRGEIIAIDPSSDVLAAAAAAGFTIIDDTRLEALGLRTVTLRTADGVPVRAALKRLQRLAPDTAFAPNHIYWQMGKIAPAATMKSDRASTASFPAGRRIGIIDGGAADNFAMHQRGFAPGAPLPSRHGTAVASLIVGGGGIQASAPGAELYVADVYGRDPAGGNARAIVAALGWIVAEDVPVVSFSLAGPRNALLERAVSAVQARGTIIIAAVGNDGPAAPPAFPASYNGVIAVTGVDARGRALIEAGKALHLDFAAPGADMLAAQSTQDAAIVRGTSFAAPLVAARVAAHYPRRAPDKVAMVYNQVVAEAVDLGRKGHDKIYGHGLVCEKCRTISKK